MAKENSAVLTRPDGRRREDRTSGNAAGRDNGSWGESIQQGTNIPDAAAVCWTFVVSTGVRTAARVTFEITSVPATLYASSETNMQAGTSGASIG